MVRDPDKLRPRDHYRSLLDREARDTFQGTEAFLVDLESLERLSPPDGQRPFIARMKASAVFQGDLMLSDSDMDAWRNLCRFVLAMGRDSFRCLVDCDLRAKKEAAIQARWPELWKDAKATHARHYREHREALDAREAHARAIRKAKRLERQKAQERQRWSLTQAGASFDDP